MMRLTINDRYIKGTVAFQESEGGKAQMSYIGTNIVPINSPYKIANKNWKVVAASGSDFNTGIINVHLVEVDG